jgi:2,3-bisphosphoglycerate-independent phosphoglycerate mutase
MPSPRDVPTYDKKPQMSAVEVTDELLRQLASEEFAFVVVNYANADMVGHSGVLAAAIAAVEVVDECLGRVVEATVRLGGVCLVTADHGNSDNLLEPDGSPNTAHSTNPVPFVATVPAVMVRQGGVLADLAPTALHLLGIAPPAEMTGRDLLVEASATPGASRPS